MRNPTPEEFAELVSLIIAAREDGQDPDAVQAMCEECWPKLIVRQAFRAVRAMY